MDKHADLGKRLRDREFAAEFAAMVDPLTGSPPPTLGPILQRALMRKTEYREGHKATNEPSALSLGRGHEKNEGDEDEDMAEGEGDDDDETDSDQDDDNEENNDVAVPSHPPQPARDIDSRKLPVLLSLYCGPEAITGETMFFLSQVDSIDKIKTLLGKHFFWEMKRAGVPADLNFMRLNCFSPDKAGPIKGAWPIATADIYKDWYEALLACSWKSGQFARIQVVALTNHQLWRDEKTYRDFLKLDENPVEFWFAPVVEDMQGEKWVYDKPMGEPIDGTGYGQREGENRQGEEQGTTQ